MAEPKREARLRADVQVIHVFPCGAKTWMPGNKAGHDGHHRGMILRREHRD